MERIGANSILPARRTPITLTTSDGLDLVGELAVPEANPPRATIVWLHPLPTHGGMMDSHLLRKSSWRLPALADLAVLRFNTRGTSSPTGTSDGEFTRGDLEGLDLAAAVDFVVAQDLPDPWLVGWSFGTDIVLRHGLLDHVRGATLLSPPLRFSTDADLVRWARDGRPITVMVPEFDDFLPPLPAAERFTHIPHANFIPVSGAKHLWVGEAATQVVLNQVVTDALGHATVLPEQWDGPMQRWSDL